MGQGVDLCEKVVATGIGHREAGFKDVLGAVGGADADIVSPCWQPCGHAGTQLAEIDQ